VAQILETNGIDPSMLVVELTESVFADDEDVAARAGCSGGRRR
jgi:EAL domain-containing protein (putative c-di-GMP-specific phosphodiesterase class I)